MQERVQKIMSNAGYCSRRRAEELIEKGKVLVNGKKIKLGDKADITKDEITVQGKIIKPIKKIYIMLNKPRGYVTTVSEKFGMKKATDLVPYDVYPVGRLDRDATGLLLLTNDGEFANKVAHPRYEVKKIYLVRLDKGLKKEDIEKIRKGIKIEKHIVKSKIKKISPRNAEVTVHTGIHKVVKRLFRAIGCRVRAICRVRIGNLKLDVKEGRYRNLRKHEVESLIGKL